MWEETLGKFCHGIPVLFRFACGLQLILLQVSDTFCGRFCHISPCLGTKHEIRMCHGNFFSETQPGLLSWEPCNSVLVLRILGLHSGLSEGFVYRIELTSEHTPWLITRKLVQEASIAYTGTDKLHPQTSRALFDC